MIGKVVTALAAGAALYGVGRALAVRQKVWAVSHSRNGYALMLRSVPTWAILAEDALEAFPCTCEMPEWAHRVGLRRFGVHNDGSNEPLHSLGSAGFALCQARHSIAFRVERDEGRVPVTREQASKLSPAFVADCDAIMATDDDDEPVVNDALRRAAEKARQMAARRPGTDGRAVFPAPSGGGSRDA